MHSADPFDLLGAHADNGPHHRSRHLVASWWLASGSEKADTDPEVPSGPIATTDTPYGVLVLSPLNVHVDVIDVVVKVEGALKP